MANKREQQQWDNTKKQIRNQMKLRLGLIKDQQDRLSTLCELDKPGPDAFHHQAWYQDAT